MGGASDMNGGRGKPETSRHFEGLDIKKGIDKWF